jgi:hypothetical protein
MPVMSAFPPHDFGSRPGRIQARVIAGKLANPGAGLGDGGNSAGTGGLTIGTEAAR